jgi:hypothetical protein
MEVADKTFADIAENFKRLLKDQKIDVKSGDGGGDDDGDHGGGRGSDKPQGRGPSAGGIPSPWRVTFPYDAPYNGPFSGGAMWSGGPSRHQGIDLALPGPNNGMGQTFGAFQPGTVYWKGFESAGGNGLIIRTDDGLYNYYGHAQRYLVDQGEHVDAGQDIGVLGESGTEGSPHLHYAVRTSVNGGHIDPVPYLTGEGPQLAGDRDLGHGMSIQDGYLVFSLFGRQYRIPLPGGKNAGDPHANADRIETYIRNAAKKRDIDEDVALEVVDSEGGLEPMRIGKFDSGWSFWPFQQHYGGKGYERYGYQAGQGTQFTKDTGWQPEDARAWPASIDWALDYALEHGWGEWYGPLKRGIGVHQGLPGFARGGLIPEPTLLVGKTLGAYAMAGEAAPEWVTPMGGGGQGGHTTVEMPVYIGNREVERFWIDGYNLNVQRGRKFLGTVPR